MMGKQQDVQQTIQQKRAKYALECVIDSAKNQAIHQDYKSYASSFPAMIHMNGLGQAAGFFRSKGATHGILYELLSKWLCGKVAGAELQPFSGYDDLLEGITQSDMHRYRLAQAEAQALMDWVKKFAKAYMRDDAHGGETS